MYQTFYHLTAEPFRLTPDHRLCYRHPSYKRAKTALEHALHLGEGFIMVTGRPGIGKTTLINDVLANLNTQRMLARLDSIHMEPGELLRMVAISFGLGIKGANKITVLQSLKAFLAKQKQGGRGAVLIVDEAQSFSPAALEELRLLSNMQQDGVSLLQVFLIGQERLVELIRSSGMEQVHQRMLAACHLEPLTVDQTQTYVKHRLQAVGWKDDPAFSDEVFPIIHDFSRGVPRPINMLCSRLLLNGFRSQKHNLVVSDIRQTIKNLHAERLTPFGDVGLPSEIEADSTKLSVDDFANAPSSDFIEPKTCAQSPLNQEDLSTIAANEYPKNTNIWRMTLLGFIAGVVVALCFIAVTRLL